MTFPDTTFVQGTTITSNWLNAVNDKCMEVTSVKDFGAVGNGVADDTSALIAAAASLQSGETLFFPSGTYLISHNGFSSFTDTFGNVVCSFSNLNDIQIIGEDVTIVLVDHDIATYGGLLMFKFANCHGVNISGFNFEMSFVNYKDSASYYPFCGSIVFADASNVDGQDPTTLNGNIIVEKCTFNLYHPLGSYKATTHPYDGDPNNGYKIFSVFASGPYPATSYDHQARNITIQDCIIKEGHNAYGFWVWAYNNAVFTRLTAESYVAKHTTSTNTIATGIPFIRHHQFYTNGATVTDCYFRAKPSSERTVSGYEGNAEFIHFTTNISGNYQFGDYIVSNNNIILGNGDSANSLNDNGALVYCYGNILFSNNNFDGIVGDTANAYYSNGIYSNVGAGGGGYANLIIDGNNFGINLKYCQNIVIFNGNNTSAATRRIKQLVVTNNTSYAQNQFFLDIRSNSATTYNGCPQVVVSNNVIDGTNSYWNSSSTNSIAMRLAASETTDMLLVNNNIISNKYGGISTGSVNSSCICNFVGNLFSGTTYDQDGLTTNTVRTDKFSVTKAGRAYFTVQSLNDPILTLQNASSSNAKVLATSTGEAEYNATAGSASGRLYQQTVATYLMATNGLIIYADSADFLRAGSGSFRPSTDNITSLGTSSNRWTTVYASTGTINTSDERAKQQVRELSDIEKEVALKLKSLLRAFKFNDAVETKGEQARIHFGVIAQQVKTVFEEAGLNPEHYALFCYDEWDDQYTQFLDEDGKPNGIEVLSKPAGNQYGIRYDELLAFMIATL